MYIYSSTVIYEHLFYLWGRDIHQSALITSHWLWEREFYVKSSCNWIRSVEVRPRAVVLPQGKSFSKMPSSLITKTYVLIVGVCIYLWWWTVKYVINTHGWRFNGPHNDETPGSSGCREEGSRFKPQCGWHMEGVLVVREGPRTTSEHCQGTLVQGTKLT